MADINPHSPPGPYILFDNLDKTNRLFFNVWLQYDELQKAEGLYMKYLYIYCKGHVKCVDLWTMDFLRINEKLNTEVEWGVTKPNYLFDTSLKSRQLTINGNTKSYFDYLECLQSNKKLRNMIFSSGDIKLLNEFNQKNSPFKISHQLVVDEDRPTDDLEWDISQNIKLRFRIDFLIKITKKKKIRLQFDRGTRGLPSIQPIGWYPTRSMDGILISKEKATPIPHFSYKKKLN